LSFLGIVDSPPPQVLPFLNLPFRGNVATFLQPFYADGGTVYLVLGLLAASFGVDFIALLCQRSRNPFVMLFWANLCFASAIAFFSPKLVSTPLWVVAAFAIFAKFGDWVRFVLRPMLNVDPANPSIGNLAIR
jgi:hypothetical protein